MLTLGINVRGVKRIRITGDRVVISYSWRQFDFIPRATLMAYGIDVVLTLGFAFFQVDVRIR